MGEMKLEMLAQLTDHNGGILHYAKKYVTPLSKEADMEDVQHQCPLLLTWFNFNPSMDK